MSKRLSKEANIVLWIIIGVIAIGILYWIFYPEPVGNY